MKVIFLQGTNRIPKPPKKVLMLSHKGARAEEVNAHQVREERLEQEMKLVNQISLQLVQCHPIHFD